MDCGPTCVKIIAKHYGREHDLEYLRQISGVGKGGVSLAGISGALESIGIEAIGIRADIGELINDVPLPAIAHWENNHFLVVYKTTKNTIYVSDPALGLIKYRHTEFLNKWDVSNKGKGILLLVGPKLGFSNDQGNDTSEPDSGRGFLNRYLMPYKDYIGQIFLGLLLASVLQLLLPFLTQSLVDYGIDHNNIGFIHLIVIAQIFLLLTRLASEVIRDWLLLHMSTQINIAMVSD